MADLTDEIWNRLIAYELATFQSKASSLSNLVHYTNFAALKGMIEFEELWFSSTSTTNDYGEISRGRWMLERLTSDPNQPLSQIIDGIRTFDPKLWEMFNTNYQSRHLGDLFHTYISCWSECDYLKRSHDNLTMWRGYASDGNGVAIVIDVTQLGLDDPIPSEIIICPVFYETEVDFAARAKVALRCSRMR